MGLAGFLIHISEVKKKLRSIFRSDEFVHTTFQSHQGLGFKESVNTIICIIRSCPQTTSGADERYHGTTTHNIKGRRQLELNLYIHC